MSNGSRARCLVVLAVLPIVACSNDRSYGEPVPAGERAAATPLRSARASAEPARIATTSTSASPSPGASAAPNPSGPAWPRGSVCGIEAEDVTALGDTVQWRSIAFRAGVLSLTEWARDVTRTEEQLKAAGFAPAPGGVAGAFTRADAGRDVTATLYPRGRAKLYTQCKLDAEPTTTGAERAGWITSYVHRRIGRGRLASLTASDGDEHYVRAQIDDVEARPDTSGFLEVAKGAYRSPPGAAEPASVVILTETPLVVEYRAGNEALIDAGLAMHAAHAPK